MTNHISGPQCDLSVRYKSLKDLPRVASAYSKTRSKKWIECPRITGFCMLIKKSVIDKIGGLDPMFGKGNYEDDDFCLRSTQSGFKSMIVGDVFVHHFGGKSFRALGEDQYLSQLEENKDVFLLKWGAHAENIWKGDSIKITQNVKIPLSNDGVEEAYVRGMDQFEKKNYSKALEYFKIAERIYNSRMYFNHELSLLDIQLRKGDCYLRRELLQEAKEEFELALQIDPTSPEVCFKLGLCFELAAIPDAALKMFECAVALNPDWLPAKQKIALFKNLEEVPIG